MKIVFRARATGSIGDLTCEFHNAFHSQMNEEWMVRETLRGAAKQFCDTMGLNCMIVHMGVDSDGAQYCEFTNGTNKAFIVFEVRDV